MGQHPEAFLAGILACFGFGIVIAKYSSLNDMWQDKTAEKLS